MSHLILKNAIVGYDRPLIQNMNAEVLPGRLISLIGENGSGKTTLMKTFLKLIKPLDGCIFYKEQHIDKFSSGEWSEVFAAVFSRMGVIPEIRVKDLIYIGQNKRNESRFQEVCNWLGINHLADNFANRISDGQLQKVMIARALMQDTPFIIFDEPTAHLDFKNKMQVFELLQRLVHKTGKTFIVITHEVLHAVYLSDEIWLIQNGQLFSGLAADINEKFQLEKEVLKFTNHDKY